MNNQTLDKLCELGIYTSTSISKEEYEGLKEKNKSKNNVILQERVSDTGFGYYLSIDTHGIDEGDLPFALSVHQTISLNSIKKMIELARQRGISSEECHWQADKKYLERRTNNQAEAVAYNGFCFIFVRKTKLCITVFQLPKHFGKKKTYYSSKDCRENYQRQFEVCCY